MPRVDTIQYTLEISHFCKSYLENW